jgi:hypothetical protein
VGGMDDCMSRRLVDMGVALFLLLLKKYLSMMDVSAGGGVGSTKIYNSMMPN